ncbi:MAG: hypothetical protein ACOC7M_00485 [Chloroflexota bacterium]
MVSLVPDSRDVLRQLLLALDVRASEHCHTVSRVEGVKGLELVLCRFQRLVSSRGSRLRLFGGQGQYAPVERFN